MKKSYLILFLVILISAGTCYSQDDNSWDKISKKGEMAVGFCAQYPPFESKTKSGKFIGFDIDLGKAIAKKLDIKAKFLDGEWQALIAGMNKGDYDILITCMSKSTARKKNVNFSDNYLNLNEVIVVRKNESHIKNFNDLKNKIIGVQMATSSEKTVNDISGVFKKVKKYNYTTDAFLDLKYKRIDAVVCGYAYAIIQIKKDPSFKITGKPLHSSEIVMVLPKGANAFTKKINNALAGIKNDGTYKIIYDKWLAIKK